MQRVGRGPGGGRLSASSQKPEARGPVVEGRVVDTRSLVCATGPQGRTGGFLPGARSKEQGFQPVELDIGHLIVDAVREAPVNSGNRQRPECTMYEARVPECTNKKVRVSQRSCWRLPRTSHARPPTELPRPPENSAQKTRRARTPQIPEPRTRQSDRQNAPDPNIEVQKPPSP